MTEAKRDQNFITTGLAYDGTNTQPLLVDPTTGRLLITIMATTLGSTKNTNISRDENFVPVGAGYDGTNAVPLHVDGTSGLLAIDLTIE